MQVSAFFREGVTRIALGDHGLWIGLVLTFSYMGLLQSRLGEGQSLAKRLLRIQVVRTDGRYLSYRASFARYLLLSLLIYSSIYQQLLVRVLFFVRPGLVEAGFSGLSLVLAVGCFVFVAFHPSKRGMHDLLVGSVVVRKGTFDRERLEQLTNRQAERILLTATGVVIALIIGVIAWTARPNVANGQLQALAPVAQQLGRDSGLRDVSVADWTLDYGQGMQHSLIASGFAPAIGDSELRESAKVTDYLDRAFTILRRAPDIERYDQLRVTVRTGIDIGIARDLQTLTAAESPSKPGERRTIGWTHNW